MTSFFSRQKVFLVLLISVVFITFQNCAKNQGVYHSSSTGIVDPFTEKKVQLSQKSLVSLDQNEVLIKANSTVSVLIDKTCALNLCRAGSKAVACSVLENQKNRILKSGRFQFFNYTFSDEMLLKDFQKQIDVSDEDSSCLVGMSENYEYRKNVFNDPTYASQKVNYDTTNFIETEKMNRDKLADVIVAVIDTGVEATADLPVVSSEDVRNYDYASDPNCPTEPYSDYYGHGTAVASIIGSGVNNQKGLTGVAPNAKIISFRIGRCADAMSSTVEIGNGILRAIDYNADVINISYGGNTGDDIGLRSAITRALGKNIIIVAAAGNDDMNISTNKFYPASYATGYSGVISVGASDSNKKKAAFSNYGSETIKIVAPGQALPAAASTHCKFCTTNWVDSSGLKMAWVSGTSFSAPIVAGGVARIVGFLKKKSISYDPLYVEQILLSLSTSEYSDLSSVAKNGALLDFLKMDAALIGLESTTPVGNAISAYGYTSGSGDTAKYVIDVYLNLTSLPPGARIGIYDSTCAGSSASCLIQDLPLSKGPKGTYTFNLTRNDLIPMDPSVLNDPNYKLPFRISVHYPIPNPNIPGAYQNNHGEMATKEMNARDIDFSNAQSIIKGEITNIRYDMRYLYVSGWTCLTGNNRATLVELRNSDTNVAYTLNFDQKYKEAGASKYPLEVLNYTPYLSDGFFMPIYKDNESTEFPMSPNMFTSQFIATNRQSFTSGMVASAKTVLECNTFTSAHGFEFAMPLKYIQDNGLKGKSFQIVSTISSKTQFVADAQGRTVFTFPDPDYKPVVSNSLTLNRTASGWRVFGQICSRSNAPADVELFTVQQQFSDSFYDKKIQPYGSSAGEFYHDPSYAASSANKLVKNGEFVFNFRIYYINPIEGSGVTLTRYESNISIEQEKFSAAWFNYYTDAIRGPYSGNAIIGNSYVLPGLTPEQSESLNIELSRIGLKQIHTGQSFAHQIKRTVYSTRGPASALEKDVFEQSGLKSIMTPSNISFNFATSGNIVNDNFNKFALTGEAATYLKDNYSVDSLQRERKVFESPLPIVGSISYDNDESGEIKGRRVALYGTYGMSFQRQGSCPNGSYSHQVDVSGTNTDWVPDISTIASTFDSTPYTGFKPIKATAEAMKRVPINLKVIQDGRLVLQLLAPMDAGFREVVLPD